MATSIGLLTPIITSATPIRIPAAMRGQAISPPQCPGQGTPSGQPGEPAAPCRRIRFRPIDIALVEHEQRKIHHQAGHYNRDQFHNLDAARRSADDVSDFEILQQFARDRARAQTTAATPSTAITPPVPETPSATINSAAMITVDSVSPEIGLFDDPITPTRYPETVAKQKPTISITIAATKAGTMPPER